MEYEHGTCYPLNAIDVLFAIVLETLLNKKIFVTNLYVNVLTVSRCLVHNMSCLVAQSELYISSAATSSRLTEACAQSSRKQLQFIKICSWRQTRTLN